MQPLHIIVWSIIVIVALAFLYSFWNSKYIISKNPFMDKHLLKRGMDKPPIWLYYDHSEVNSRQWADFGARSSRALHMPFLNLCYGSILAKNKDKYRIEVISGLSGVADLLGGWNNLPPGLREQISPVNEAEMNWIRAAILAKFGGIWLSPYSIAIKPFGEMPKDQIVFFGTDVDEIYAGSAGTHVPGFRCIWSPKPNEPMFVEWEQLCRDRISPKRGGEQIRGDVKWDWNALSSKYGNRIHIKPYAEGTRKKGGKRIQLEDLLATGHEGNLPFQIHTETVYFPIFWPELRDREYFGWFLRMSEDQIMNSDISVKYLLNL
jgi:hypothetical protein